MKVIQRAEPGGLESLAGEAEGLQAGAQADQAGAAQGEGGQPDAQPAAPSNADIIAQGLALVRDTLAAFAKVQSIKRTMNDEACRTLADVWAPVCDKHGMNLSAMAGDYLPELRAIMTTVGIVTVAWSELRDEVRAMKAKPVQPDDQAGGADAPAAT